MRADIKARWLEALRSGRYKQGRGHLRVDDSYCCLGVLCEVAVADGVIPPGADVIGEYHRSYPPETYEVREIVYEYGTDHLQATDTQLPSAVRVWAGLPERDPRIPLDFRGEEAVDVLTLAEINDCHRAPFPIIANLIEMFL